MKVEKMSNKQEYNVENIKIVPIEKVTPNTWNPKIKGADEYQTVYDSINNFGFRQPIIVRNSKEADTYEILDGEQRYTAAKELGYTNIPIYNLGNVADKEAKETTLWMEIAVPLDRVLQAQLVKSMTETYEDLQLPYTDDEVDNMVKILEYDPNALLDEDFSEPDAPDMDKLLIRLTKDQLKIIQETINYVKEENECSDGRALEFICIEYRNMPEGTTGSKQM